MPIGPLLPAVITGGASLLGGAIGAISQAEQNRKSREWQEKMYGRQRADSLADFAMQNLYNHPSSQMARLREAGLNPNLVYGHGQATQASATPRASQSGSWSPIAPKIDLGAAAASGLGAYLDFQVKQAQVDNLRVQNTVLEQERLLKIAQTIGEGARVGLTNAQTHRSQFDLELDASLKENTIATKEASLQKIEVETKAAFDENERRAAMQAPNLKIAAETILNMRKQRAKTDAEISHINQQIENLKQDVRIKKFDEETQEKGIPRNSPAWWRFLANIIGQKFTSAQKEMIKESGFKINVGQYK